MKNIKILILISLSFLAISILGGFVYLEFFKKDDISSEYIDEVPSRLEIKYSFESYIKAILNDNGRTAINFLDSRTKDYYNNITEIIKYGSREEVEDLNLFDRFMVLIIRNKVPSEEILAFKENGLLLYALNNGLVGKDSVPQTIDPNNIIINGTFAKARVPGNLYLHFYKENDIWKLDLTSLFTESTVIFKQLQNELDMEENEFILYMIEIDSGKPNDNIWMPVSSDI